MKLKRACTTSFGLYFYMWLQICEWTQFFCFCFEMKWKFFNKSYLLNENGFLRSCRLEISRKQSKFEKYLHNTMLEVYSKILRSIYPICDILAKSISKFTYHWLYYYYFNYISCATNICYSNCWLGKTCNQWEVVS
jgi:hypothetical protein